MKKSSTVFAVVFCAVFLASLTRSQWLNAFLTDEDRLLARIEAHNSEERTLILEAGVAVETLGADFVLGIGARRDLRTLEDRGFRVQYIPWNEVQSFPPEDINFHEYQEIEELLSALTTNYSHIMKLYVIGQSVEGRPIWAIRVSDHPDQNENEPGIAFMATHHAREHLSTEVPLFLLNYLAENYETNSRVHQLIDDREIWIIPLVNPDGVIYDLEEPHYKWWRKNKATHFSGIMGVDLNRNYGFMWGGRGASSDPRSETYRGPSAFSEPETRAIRDFITSYRNITILLSYHTFSELVLYPWGHTEEGISNQRDLAVYEKMAAHMGNLTGYTPMKSSGLYLVSGDTTDWAYGTFGTFAFTFELSPASQWEGGFYPDDEIIPQVNQVNLEPALYLTELADNPYRALLTK